MLQDVSIDDGVERPRELAASLREVGHDHLVAPGPSPLRLDGITLQSRHRPAATRHELGQEPVGGAGIQHPPAVTVPEQREDHAVARVRVVLELIR